MHDSPRIAGIVLCGGKSSRMGREKAWLPVGDETMLARVVRILSGVVSPIVVVAAQGQELPELPQGVLLARDEHDSLGPLAGIAAGLARLAGECDAAYVSSCDAPLLAPAFVEKMIDSLDDYDLVIPRDGKFHHPLAAVYRTSLAPAIEAQVAARRLRTAYMLHLCKAREIDVAELRAVDPELRSLWNINTPDDYRAALLALEAAR